MPAKYQYTIIAPNLRGATNLLVATGRYLIALAREARQFKKDGLIICYQTWVNRCKELYIIYKQIKEQWKKMEY